MPLDPLSESVSETEHHRENCGDEIDESEIARMDRSGKSKLGTNSDFKI